MYPSKTLYTAEQSTTEKKINIYKKWEINNQNKVVSPTEQQEDSKLMLTMSGTGIDNFQKEISDGQREK